MRTRYLPFVLLSIAAILGAEPKRDRFGDPLPERAIARLGSLRLRPQWPVFTGAFTPDGKFLATGGGRVGGKGEITFWDLASGKEARHRRVTLPFRVHALRFTADGKSLIVVGNSGGFCILDAASGAKQRKLNPSGDFPFLALDVARDGKTAVTTDFLGNIVVWDLARGERLREFQIPRKLVTWFDRFPFNPVTVLTPDGKHLVLPHADGTLHLVEVTSGKEVAGFEMPAGQHGWTPDLQIVAVSPDGRYLAYGCRDTPATICDLKTGKRLHALTSPRKSIFGLLFVPDSRVLGVQYHGEMRFFDTDSGEEVRRLAKSSGVGHPLALSADGKTLALLEDQHALSLWDVGSGRQMHSAVRHVSLVQSLVFFPDGKRLVSSDQSGNRIVWDIASAQVIAHNGNVYDKPRSLAVDADGKTVRFLSDNYLIHRWLPDLGGKASQQKIPPNLADFVLSPDGRTLAATVFATPISQVQLRDLQGGKEPRTFTIPNKERVSYLVFSPDSQRLLTGGADSTFRLWDRDTGKLLRELPWEDPRRGPGYGILTPDGRSLVYFDYTLGYHLRLREIVSGEVRLRVPLPNAGIPLACSPDGRFLACSQLSRGILVLGTATGKELARWQGPQESMYSLAFSPDSRLLASGYGDGTILLWKVPDGESLPATLKPEEAEELWKTLAESDAPRANRALAGLAAAPAQAVPLIKDRFPTVWKKPDAKMLARLIAELDGDSFAVRERATRVLSEADFAAAHALRQALAKHPSPEAKRRLETLLNRLSKGGSSKRLRALRAIEVLERIGTPQAKDVLRLLTDKSLSEELHEEVHASLRRMDAKPSR